MTYITSKHSLAEVLEMFCPFVAIADGDIDDWSSFGHYCLQSVGICKPVAMSW